MVKGYGIYVFSLSVASIRHSMRVFTSNIFFSPSPSLSLFYPKAVIFVFGVKKNTVHIIVRYTVKIWKSWKHIIFLFATLSETFYLLDNNNSSGVFHFIWKLLYPLGFEIHADKQQDTLSINYMSLSNTFRAVHFFIPRGCYFNPSYVLISCVRMISRIG